MMRISNSSRNLRHDGACGRRTTRWVDGDGCDDDRCAVAQDFRDATHDLGGVVTNTDDCVGAMLASMFDHEVEGILACALAQLREKRDVAAEKGLKRPSDRTNDAPRPYDDPTNDALGLDDPMAIENERGRRHAVIHVHLYTSSNRRTHPPSSAVVPCAGSPTSCMIELAGSGAGVWQAGARQRLQVIF